MKSMFDMIRSFPAQMEEAINLGSQIQFTQPHSTIQKIFVSGMGGSGIGAEFVASFIKTYCHLPFIINKSYDIPAWIDKNTLVIISSYSGNTEETLSALQQVIQTEAKIICISSGGEVIETAKTKQLDYVEIPSGWSSPRACLGYSIILQLFTLNQLQLIKDDFKNELLSAIQRLKSESSEIIEKAKHLASVLHSKMLVIYCTDRIEPVAIRLRQQINENAKMLCWHHVIPEMNHNELVGWRWSQEALAVLFLRNADDHPRNHARLELTKEITSHYTSSVVELYSRGDSIVERSFYLVHLLDYLSVFLADYNKVDAIEVRVIDFLKNELSKI